jgi:hypothetical protein
MGDRRVAALAVLAYGVLFVAGGVFLGDILGALGDADGVFVEHYATGTNRTGDIVGCSLLVVAGAAFLVFVAAMRRVLADGGLALDVFSMAGMAFVVLWLVAVGLLMTTPLSISFGGAFSDTGQFGGGHSAALPQAGTIVLLVCALPMAGLAIGALAVAARSGRGLPSWHVWLSYVCANALVFAFSYMTLIAMPVWCTATAVAMWRGSRNA